MTLGNIAEWTLKVIIPSGSGQCLEHEVNADPKDSGLKLKQRIEKICGIPTDDMELFARGDGEGCKQKWLAEDASLQEQEVVDGGQVAVGVHGMRSSSAPEDSETGELATDPVQISMNTKGDTSYYFAHSTKCELSDEQRIVSGGEPLKIADGVGQALSVVDPVPLSAALFDDHMDPARPRKSIKNYAWGDEKEVIKIYISKELEPEAIQAAGDGRDGQVEVKWLPKAFKLTVHGKQLDHVLILDRLYYEIVPEECSFRVSLDKRISLTLKKQEAFTWLKLLKPE